MREGPRGSGAGGAGAPGARPGAGSAERSGGARPRQPAAHKRRTGVPPARERQQSAARISLCHLRPGKGYTSRFPASSINSPEARHCPLEITQSKPVPRQHYLEQVTQEHSEVGAEGLQGRGLHRLPEQPVPTLNLQKFFLVLK